MSEENSVTVKNHLVIGRTLAILDMGATLAGGAALVVLSPAVVPAVLGAVAATTGIYRAGAIIRGWKKPSTFITGTVETITQSPWTASDDTKEKMTETITLERKTGAKNYSAIGAVAKLGAGIALLTTSLPAVGGAASLGLGIAGGVMAAVGAVGTIAVVAASPFLVVALCAAAVVGTHRLIKKLRGKKNTQPSQPQATQTTTPAPKFKKIKAVFNHLSPLSKDRTPFFKASLGEIANKNTISSEYIRRNPLH